jgi:nucleotide-binding universal stress UspA family protein
MSTSHGFPAATNGLPHSILVAFDDSPHAWRALEHAVALANAAGARLTILSVAQQPRVFVSAYTAPIPSEEQLLEEAEAALASAVRSVPNDLSVKSVALVGDPADEILRESEQGGHDLIVMGTRGHGEAVSLAIGSVSHSVLRRASVPVLVVRDVASVPRDDSLAAVRRGSAAAAPPQAFAATPRPDRARSAR